MPETGSGTTAMIHDVVIIGTGFSGLGLAIALKREAKHDFVVLERAGDVGGTWRDNIYPGAACDIPSHLYSYSFRQNPNWSSVFGRQGEIFEYLRSAADDENVRPHIRFHTTVTRADWEADEACWVVSTDKGVFKGRALVSAAGHLSDPAFPNIVGLSEFKGKVFHSAQWDHSYDMSGKRVAVIGTGASAIQIVPELAKAVDKLVVFQRTAPYIVPRRDTPYSAVEKRMFQRLPKTQQQVRDEYFWFNEGRFLQRRRVPTFISIVANMSRTHLDDQIKDEELKKKVTPSYEIGCKRILISNEYYPTLQQQHVTLETSGIERVTGGAIECRDGASYPFDAIVLATGFEATDLPIADHIYGRGGLRLADTWKSGPKAYACASMAGFPNFFMMLGPNTGLGAGSMVYMAETQVEYIKGGLNYLLDRGVVIEPEQEAEDAFLDDIYARSQGTVWVAGGCSSWYLHPSSGRLTALWPDFMRRFRLENGSFSADGYAIRQQKASAEPAGLVGLLTDASF